MPNSLEQFQGLYPPLENREPKQNRAPIDQYYSQLRTAPDPGFYEKYIGPTLRGETIDPMIPKIMGLATIPAMAAAPGPTLLGLLNSWVGSRLGGSVGESLGSKFGWGQRGRDIGQALGQFLPPGIRQPAMWPPQLVPGRAMPTPESLPSIQWGSRLTPQTTAPMKMEQGAATTSSSPDPMLYRKLTDALMTLGQSYPHVLNTLQDVRVLPIGGKMRRGDAAYYQPLSGPGRGYMAISEPYLSNASFPDLIGTLGHELTHAAQFQPQTNQLVYMENFGPSLRKTRGLTRADVVEPGAYSKGSALKKQTRNAIRGKSSSLTQQEKVKARQEGARAYKRVRSLYDTE